VVKLVKALGVLMLMYAIGMAIEGYKLFKKKKDV
jgi:Kef-type K+ transport system membrane component KefB